MLQTLGLLLVCQLVSEFVASGLSLPISGPALGLVVLLAALVVRSSLAGALRPTCHVIMAHLSLMFLPRQRWGYWQFRRSLFDWAKLLVVLTLSTILSMLVTVATFITMKRLIYRLQK